MCGDNREAESINRYHKAVGVNVPILSASDDLKRSFDQINAPCDNIFGIRARVPFYAHDAEFRRVKPIQLRHQFIHHFLRYRYRPDNITT